MLDHKKKKSYVNDNIAFHYILFSKLFFNIFFLNFFLLNLVLHEDKETKSQELFHFYFLPIRISDLVFKSRCMCRLGNRNMRTVLSENMKDRNFFAETGIDWEFIIKFDFKYRIFR